MLENDLGAMIALSKLHKIIDDAEAELRGTLGVPLCVPNCGACCGVPAVRRLEADVLASWLLGSGLALKVVLDRCREWLLRPGKVGTKARPLTKHEVLAEVERIRTGYCPFLEPDKRCLVHGGRPIICRSYEVVKHNPACKRPIGFGETQTVRAVVGGEVAREYKMAFLGILSMASRKKSGYGLLPTLLFARFRGPELAGLMDSGRVATARTLVFDNMPAELELRGLLEDSTLREIEAVEVPLVEEAGRLIMKGGAVHVPTRV